MQFKVPQNVQREDRIVGPLTLRHMIILGAGGGLAYIIYVILSRTYYWEVWAAPVGIIVIITVVAAFVKIYNVAFGRFIILLLEYILFPKQRKWFKYSAEIEHRVLTVKKPSEAEKKAEKKGKKAEETFKKLEDLSKMLDSYGKEVESSEKSKIKK